MIGSLLVFISCLFLGVMARLWFVGLLKIQLRIGLPAGIALEFVSMGLLFGAFAAIIFIGAGGVFSVFTAIGVAIGFVATSLLV